MVHTCKKKIKKLRDAARDQSCVRCGKRDGTIVLAHYSGMNSHKFGKGMGTKCHDLIGAHLCYDCHTYMDSYKDGNDDTRRADFYELILLTILRLYSNNNI